jgi:PAS domain S-box-containing protein
MIRSIIRYISERTRTKAEIQRLYALNEVLSRTHRAIMHAPDRAALLNDICRIAVRQGGFEVACVFGAMNADQTCQYLAWFGNAVCATPVSPSEAAVENCLESPAAGENKPFFLNDARDRIVHLPWLSETPLRGFGSCAWLPLGDDRGFAGVLALYADDPQYFDEATTQLLGGIAHDISFGLSFLGQRDELRDSKERLTSILGTVDAVVWSVDAFTNQLLYINPSVARITGRAAEEMFERPGLWLEMILPSERGRVADQLAKSKFSGVFDCDYRIRRPDGTVRWISDHGKLVLDALNHPVRIDGVATDITERRIGEIVSEAIQLISNLFLTRRDQSDIYFRIAEFLADRLFFPMVAIALYDPVAAQVEFMTLTGGFDFFAPGMRISVDRTVSGTVAMDGKPWFELDIGGLDDPRFEMLRKMKASSFLCLPLRTEKGPWGTLGVADTCRRPDLEFLQSPLTLVANHLALELDRRRKARILDRNAQYLRRMIDGLFIFVGLMTPEGILIDVNRTVTKTDLALGDMLGKPLEETDWWSYSEQTQERLRAAVNNAGQGKEVRYSERIRLADGRMITTDVAITPILNETGQIIYLIVSVADIGTRSRPGNELSPNPVWLQLLFDLSCLDLSGIGLAITSLESRRFLKVNEAFCELLGYSEGELLGLAWTDVTCPEDVGREMVELEQLARGAKEGYALDKRYIRKDGELVKVRVNVRFDDREKGTVEARIATVSEGGELGFAVP